jgi:uncharacterized protein
MEIFQQFQGFDWDDANKDKKWHSHTVAWWECEEVFFNQPLYVHKDNRYSLIEERFYSLGKTNNSRLIFMVFTRRKSKIRVISARDMHKKERKIYYEKAKRDSKV